MSCLQYIFKKTITNKDLEFMGCSRIRTVEKKSQRTIFLENVLFSKPENKMINNNIFGK